MRRKAAGRQGFILVEALVVIACLVALMAMLVADQRAALQEMQNHLRQRRAEVAAKSAVARALATLQNVDPNLVTLNDEWALLGDNGNQEFALGNAAFRLQIVDANALLNLNTATEAQLQLLPLEQEQIDSLLDWREAGQQERPNGAKDTYYNGLPQPYNVKLGRLATLSELLLIKGWTARTIYAPPTGMMTNLTLPEDLNGNLLPLASMLTIENGASNTRSDGSARINFGQGNVNVAAIQQLIGNPVLAQQIAASAPFTSFSQLLGSAGIPATAAQQLLDAVTFTGGPRSEGKLNLNTATQAAFQTVPDITPDIADAIVSRQSAGFNSLGELTTVPGLTGALLGRVADAVTVGSDTWIVRAYGESGGVPVAIEATVGWRNERPQILTWNRLNTPGIPAWWNWEQEPTSTLEAGAGL